MAASGTDITVINDGQGRLSLGEPWVLESRLAEQGLPSGPFTSKAPQAAGVLATSLQAGGRRESHEVID